MALQKIKEFYRIFFLVKGHLNCSEDTARSCYDSYFKRCWYNQESWIREEAFEIEYKKKFNPTV